MKRALMLGGALMLSVAPIVATADESLPPRPIGEAGAQLLAQATVNEGVDAGKLIGADVVDGTGEKVGEIDSVMVDPDGNVSSVVMDVSGWLESEKLVAVSWSDLKVQEDGKVVTSLNKDAAKAAAAFNYKDPQLRGQVLTEEGERYAASDTDGSTTAETDETQTADTGANADADSPVTNADGSVNASKLIGVEVKSPDDDKVGDIGEVVLDKGGEVQGVVVDVGGFLGLGSRPVLLNWKDVTLTDKEGEFAAVVNITKDRLEQMPVYDSSKD